ncbi:MAG: murein biosynthesis integral membrane protein MurJ [Candidatus Yanofskybacteria bacterium RIFCSPLOWO2_12_FULL_43_11b]|uniref:Probable lipid II flippase MurJ n=1 Tax=Candidatus Yanofskybacteria bacterium RIFCSPLOWO2_12_FULL_43_11b TaxID=1802710 RepID=A0A1F8H8T8_9BACT|nr:MAG: murein biosynthesis integral membrane protein MurJ [Candidatus Yanofskybacteria bacterium RIFCSPHIGHO2_01_FULL_43_32]OGN24878.1 MAG: murein biosynthesis integral membrane protein MurJ [Candidatus Yanofskybacteria bacterium RIFCSPLOWO2_01_FULL_43_46]OGN33309.1 MAG: murein biosynthesis integral membrane protein MurJ [Candidatus Yanofskybacteria bacterium RIFCSPLOWO2_12_FULL_43_11b]
MLAFLGLFSRVLGVLRDRILASHFGASDLLDVYYVSFNIPDFIFNLLVVGAVASAFIPVFVEYQAKKDGGEWNLANNFLNTLITVMTVTAGVMFIFTPGLINIIAPGFSSEKKELAVLFTRIMLFSPIIFSISVVIGSILQVFHRFLAYALAPIMYNLGIIFGAIFFVPKFGPLGLAEGVVLGALFHLLVQLPALKGTGFKWKKVWNFGDSGMRKILKLMVPRTIGVAVIQINFIILNALSSRISPGSVTVINLANNFQYLPISLVGISTAVASFPTLSRQALEGDKTEFTERISRTLRRILFIVLPLSFLMIYLRTDLIRIVLGSGLFRSGDIELTGNVLGFFMVGVFAQSIIPFLARSFYAMQNTRIPVVASIAGVAANIFFAWYFSPSLNIFALPMAFSLAGILNAVILSAFLKYNLRTLSLKELGVYSVKLLYICAVMILVIILTDIFVNFDVNFTGSLYQIITLSLVGILTFAVFSSILDIKEAEIWKAWRKFVSG